jgi:flavin reductase (DIM6/NTAB) family NADH-FMN oxidoreductase RutF
VRGLDAAALDKEDVLRLLSSVVAPRPLFLLSTVDAQDGRVNLAPFSSVVPLAAMPPLLGIVIHPGQDGTRKTTLRNIDETHELVAHPVTPEWLESAVRLSLRGSDLSEDERVRLRLTASDLVRPPRALALPIQIECRVREGREIASTEAVLVVAEIARLHLSAALVDGTTPVLERFDWVGHVATLTPGSYAFTRGGTLVRLDVGAPRSSEAR